MPPSKNNMRPIHPGEILFEEYMRPLELSANRLGEAIGVPHNRITEIVAGRRSITADTALRLARAFETTPEFWMNLQQAYDLRSERRKPSSKAISAIRPLLKTG